jgi:hypothetical protein
MIFADLATLCAALFAGSALYGAAVEHPARVACGPPMAVAHFRTSYRPGAWLQGSLAVVGALAAIGAWAGGAPLAWLVAALALTSVVPYTLLVMESTSRRLRDRSLAPDFPETQRLLRRWGLCHLVRVALGLLALGLIIRNPVSGG